MGEEGLGQLDSFLRASPKDTALQSSLYAKTMSTAVTASRLAALRKPLVRPPTHLTPIESFAAAGNRTDLIVIPNVKVDEAAAAKRAAVIEVRFSPFSPVLLLLYLYLCLRLFSPTSFPPLPLPTGLRLVRPPRRPRSQGRGAGSGHRKEEPQFNQSRQGEGGSAQPVLVDPGDQGPEACSSIPIA